MRISLITYGCKLNQYETELMAEKLENFGFIVVNGEVESDIFILNTCAVTAEATRKIRQEIRRLRKKYPESKIIAAGCYSQIGLEDLKKEGVDLIVGNKEKKDIHKIINKTGIFLDKKYWKNDEIDGEIITSSLAERTRAYVKVEDGCDNVCTYCAIRLARGMKIRSKPIDIVVNEVSLLVKKNYHEIVITGLNLGKYGFEKGYNLIKLLRNLVKIKGDFRIRLSSINPEDIDEELIEFIANEDKICNHLHIPLQSGSDEILKRMRRNYTQKEYLKVIEILRRYDPNFSVTTDIIVGFPGETEKDFENTLMVVKEALFSKVHGFRYSDREGTLASRFNKKIPGNIKRERISILEKESKKTANIYRRGLLNKKVTVLVENVKREIYSGYDEYYVVHEMAYGELGEFNEVVIEAVTDEGVISTNATRKVSGGFVR
ncbi:tRNA (N(6)-L-threonylcarbamoyladenosine(37)-C(2))-methylthiotransferase MtaB [Thermosipho atlanticus]|uniref:Threonylcarbamoyladenosine tRNA methylthiotransferase MtaB n=1 Tax=Thermosipho atlanticus DSM 15807 TaxID=1123380 RepID=A0A1M5T5C6_9BACT|nr:tRNA (N(6)-L-threonylcarbamoyladenosine(37)-C(2))-methylthiotransferase MtaB [Thermosipho atlanticus]SHH45949.1 threonylcarbamoyladenosine tRNA methylthiotransferase MtaB [Thermosipho atlanticus DSM 15807]